MLPEKNATQCDVDDILTSRIFNSKPVILSAIPSHTQNPLSRAKEKEKATNIPNLITPRPSHISRPPNATTPTLLKNLQTPHYKPTTRKHLQREAQAQQQPAPTLQVRHT